MIRDCYSLSYIFYCSRMKKVRAHNGSARARKSNVIRQRGGKPFWEKNELLPCCILEYFLVRNAHESDTYLK